jgi:hypothetical protein
MSIHTRGPFSWAGGPIGHTSANAGVAANAAAVPSTPRRDIRLENGWLSFGIVVSPGHNLRLACNNPATEKVIPMSRRVKCRFESKADMNLTSLCPLYPQKRTCAVQTLMSALGQKRTLFAQD